ncbi:hypothetical protein Glove_40g157 [Diversispora epigaea]|uniref:DNA polymerase n=1 Tax=Diversispora epigaea TaxID=1348612 RepID=A0A397JHY6_9GLOM|nr:hypothetical protein Glove_40g157 [Diversispora epigaea]
MTPLIQICLVDVETKLDPNWITVICGNQTNLLKAFALCWKYLAPDIQKLYSKAEKSSLAFYLEECKLKNKVDLPIHRMNKYYERALKETNNTTTEQMHEVAKYCINDALSCQRLMVKHNVINEYRKKVWELGFLNTMNPQKQTESGKYPGAYVFPPEKGLENKRPVTSLDYASLYPSLIMTYNLSPDKIILTREHAISVARSGKKLHRIDFQFKGSDIIAWSVKHENQLEMEGLYVIVLKELLIKRNEMKKCLAPLSEKKENMELILSNIEGELTIPEVIEYILKNTEKKNRDKLTKKLYPFINKNNHEFMVEYNSICFDHACLNAKQTALKVYVNTFYGASGSSDSPFFSLPLVGGVTSAGQRNIKLVADFVKNKGFQIKYGDTDSLYLVCPEEYFQECDTAYNDGNGNRISKEKYWNEMIKISMRVMGELRDEVNKFLKKDNGNTYLKMAYEEVLFPVVFTGKKKYYGIQHIKELNFDPNPDKLFIKDIDIVKRGQSKLSRKIGKEIMRESMEINNNKTLYQIVEVVLKKIVKNSFQIEINECIKTYAWKPDKDNKSVKCFISRMKSKYIREVVEFQQLIKKGLSSTPYIYNIPEPGERFECIVIEEEPRYDELGDYMEYPDVAKKLNKKIDINYYLKSVVNLCARFINSDKYGPKKEEAIISHLWKDATTHAQKICSSISKAGITRPLGASTGHNNYLNALDKIADSIYLKLSDLLSKLSKLNVEYRNGLYRLIMQAQKCKPNITILEEYIFRYNLESECEALIKFRNTWYKVIGLESACPQALSIMQKSKKDNSPDINEIIDLYCSSGII